MRDKLFFNYETPNDAQGAGAEPSEAPAAPAETTPAAPAPAAPPSWQGPSQEEWQQTQQALNYMAQLLTPQEQQQYADDEGEIDIEQYIAHAVESRLAPVRPLLDVSVKERGEKVMTEIFDRVSAEPDVGDFDRKLAERIAQSYLPAFNGDPVKATEEAAREAARIRAEERKAGETSYMERLRKGPADYEPPGGGGTGNRGKTKAKSYDEVIANWAGETEA